MHAGSFYPADANELAGLVDSMMENRARPLPGLMGIIVPHAGFAYSGPTASLGYAALPPETERVILLGPSHHYYLSDIRVWDEEDWETPLGDVSIDRDMVKALVEPGHPFSADARPFLPEHSVEVQAPFLKRILPAARVVPCLVGTLSSHDLEEAATRIREILGEHDIVIATSDLYHGESYEECVEQDRRTLSLLGRLNGKGFAMSIANHEAMACGGYAVALLLEIASGMPNARSDVLGYTNSAEVTGSYMGYVVGYAAVAITSG